MSHMKHKDYLGSVEVSHKDGCLHGKILFIDDLVIYEAETVNGLRKEFEAAVDDYLETCAQVGKDPDRPFSGTFQIRVPPEIHRQAAMEAKIDGQSLNEWVGESISMRLRAQHTASRESDSYKETTEMIRVLREREAKNETYGQA